MVARRYYVRVVIEKKLKSYYLFCGSVKAHLIKHGFMDGYALEGADEEGANNNGEEHFDQEAGHDQEAEHDEEAGHDHEEAGHYHEEAGHDEEDNGTTQNASLMASMV